MELAETEQRKEQGELGHETGKWGTRTSWERTKGADGWWWRAGQAEERAVGKTAPLF